MCTHRVSGQRTAQIDGTREQESGRILTPSVEKVLIEPAPLVTRSEQYSVAPEPTAPGSSGSHCFNAAERAVAGKEVKFCNSVPYGAVPIAHSTSRTPDSASVIADQLQPSDGRVPRHRPLFIDFGRT